MTLLLVVIFADDMFDSSKLRRIREPPLATVPLLHSLFHRSFCYSRLFSPYWKIKCRFWPLPPKANWVYSSWVVEVLLFLGAPGNTLRLEEPGQSLSGSISAPRRKAICAGGR
ncbi:hypothetical protein F2Q68_00043774 [Brassica cretica]|uniref:Uncharacterized protein n=1 Tax=Brassica cretica TaxID=69181 RepID=A0A8S9LN24_BRACR|nr:hypothetical protein F2Q68_00043774 [Brassica cretica]